MPQPGDRILEIGFGPGDAIARITRQIKTGLIVGIDHSHTMLIQASRRNAYPFPAACVEAHKPT